MLIFTSQLHCLLLLVFSSIAWGYTLRGSIAESALPLSSADLTGTTVRLISSNNAHIPFYETFLKSNGEFQFSNVALGNYLLSLDSASLATDAMLKVVVTPSQVIANKIFPGHDWETDLGPAVEYPIVIDPIQRPIYVAEREKFSALAMLKSPMVLLTLGSLLMVFLIPKMTEGLGKYKSIMT